MTADVLKNSLVSGRRPARIVLGWQSIDRHDELQAP